MRIEEFNALSGPDAVELASSYLRIEAWVKNVVGGRPYASVDDLAERAHAACFPYSAAQVNEAVAGHAKIGERPSGSSREARYSRQEQKSASGSDDLTEELRRANSEYTERFATTFIIRAAGRSQAEMLAELRRRMGNDEATELREQAENLREIALLRLRAQFTPVAAQTPSG